MHRTRVVLSAVAASAAVVRLACARCKAGIVFALFVMVTQTALSAPADREIALHNAQVTVRARQALYHDNLLSSLNLGVSVRNHVATLWGQAPTAFLAQRALDRVKEVPGVARVVNRLTVETPGDPLLRFLKSVPQPEPPPTSEKRVAPAALMGRDDEPTAPPAMRPAWQAPPAPAARNQGVVLMPAIPLPAQAQAAGSAQGSELAQAVELLRQGNTRLNRVRAEVKGKVVHLHGFVYAWNDLYEFAKQLSRLSGVERVILESVKLDAQPSR